jgi:capsid assembly protease
MQMHSAAQWVLSHRWAITPEMLETIIAIADRQTGFDESKLAIAAKDSEPLANTRRADIRDGVAIIPVLGPIFPRANLFTMVSGGTSIQTLAKDFTVALNDPNVNAIVFNIDSPGGEVTGVSEFAAMIYNSRDKKPSCAYVYGLGASAAYWIGSACTKMVVSDTAEIGSIGVVSAYNDTREKDKKNGVQTIEIVSSFSPKKRLDPLTDEGKSAILKIVDDLAAEFIGAVAKHRDVTTAKVLNDFGQGDVMVGKHAVVSGMVDSVGNFEAVIESYSQQKNFQGGLLMNLTELKAQHPDTYKAAVELGKSEGIAEGQKIATDAARSEGAKEGRLAGELDGAKKENARIKSIEDIAISGSEAIIASEKFKPEATAETVSLLILKSQKKAMAGVEADALALATKTAGIAQQAPLPGESKNAEADKSIDAAVARANKTRR